MIFEGDFVGKQRIWRNRLKLIEGGFNGGFGRASFDPFARIGILPNLHRIAQEPQPEAKRNHNRHVKEHQENPSDGVSHELTEPLPVFPDG